MKILVALVCLAAAAFAAPAPAPGYLAGVHGGVVATAPAVVLAGHGVHPGYAAYGPAHIAVRSDGYLLDIPEVAATRSAHLTAVAHTASRDAHINAALAAVAAPALIGAYGHPW